MLHALLKQLDFNDKEITIYLAILEKGKVSPVDVSQTTGINRTTVYSVAKELIRRGIVSEDLGASARLLVAKPPRELERLIDKQLEMIEKRKEVIEQVVPELEKITKGAVSVVPKIVYIPEENLESYLHSRAEVWNESILKTDGIWWGFQDETFTKQYKKWIDWYWKNSAPATLKLQLLSNQSQIEKEFQKKSFKNRVIKFWNKNVEFTGTTWVNGDYLVMITTGQSPHALIEIHDATLAHNFRELCKGIWKTLK